MSRASTDTLLPLDRYAAVLGLVPPAFNQGSSSIIFPGDTNCNLIFQYAWQYNDAVAREDIAREIAMAEQDIANYMGWWPAPRWIAQDVKMYPRFHRPEYYSAHGVNVRYQGKSIKAAYGKIIEPGQRAVTEICTAEQQGDPCSLTFSDEDGDGFGDKNGTIESTIDEVLFGFAITRPKIIIGTTNSIVTGNCTCCASSSQVLSASRERPTGSSVSAC